jgi:anti-sigma B factor antagonist
MNFTVEKRNNVVIFTLKNVNLDSKISSKLKAEVLILAQPDISALILDLSNVEYVDSNGLGALLLAHRQLKYHDIPVALVGVQDMVMKIITISQIKEIFDYYDTVDDGVAVYGKNED